MRTIESSFNQTRNFDLCDDIFMLYADITNDINVAEMKEHERIISLTWHFGGIIDNGGFGYLYCADIKGDPHYRKTAEAFGVIGCDKMVSAFEESFGWFPKNTPPADVEKRRRYLARVSEKEKTRVGRIFYKQSEFLPDYLAKYIRAHRAEIEKDLRKRGPKQKKP